MNAVQDIVVVGAGPAGLAVTHELKQRGIDPLILEKSDKVASSWRARHDHLELNTYRGFSHQPGMAIPRRYGQFPARDDYIRYLENYTDWLRPRIEFETEVKRIDPAEESGGWKIETSNGPVTAEHVIVATGSDREPHIPDWPGRETYRGEIIHAGAFGNAGRYAEKSILMVGAGNSAFDIGNYLAEVPLRESWLSVRRTTTVIPKHFLGLPSQAVLVLVSWLPEAVQDGMIWAVSRLGIGNLRGIGLPPPEKGGLRNFREEGVTIAVDEGFAKALKKGVFKVVPPISRFSEDRVHLEDGRELQPDIVICATGYRPGLEPLVGHLDVLDEKGYPRALGGEGVPEQPGLWFLGQNSHPYGNMNIRRGEARRLAENITRAD